MMLNGYSFIASPLMTKDGDPIVVGRTLKEMFFTFPWKPWLAYKTIIPIVPRDDALVDENNRRIFVHPSVLEQIKKEVPRARFKSEFGIVMPHNQGAAQCPQA